MGLILFTALTYIRLPSALLHKLLTDGGFPDLKEQLTYFENSFDRSAAKEQGIIIPREGVNKDYDSSQQMVNSILKELDQYLKEQQQKLKCKVRIGIFGSC